MENILADQTEKENILASEDWRKVPLDSEKHGIVEKARLSEVLSPESYRWFAKLHFASRPSMCNSKTSHYTLLSSWQQ